MQNNLDITKTIPTGSELRILLNSSHISYGEIHTTLKEKGIFVGDSSKKTTVPLLSSTLLTDTEFTRLLDKSIDRESKPKVKVSNLDLCAPKSDWTTPLKGIFGLDKFDPAHDIESIEFKSRPRLTINSPDKATIKYTAHRRDISQDLIKRELTFTGELTIERDDKELKLYASSEHTAPETEKINNRLLSHLSKALKASGIVSKENPSKITFGLFSNKERILFFKRLAGGLSPSLTLGSVNDIEVSLNKEGVPLPNDPKIDWMKDTVNRVKIDGKRLNNIFLIDDDTYYNYYYILKMEINYSYEFTSVRLSILDLKLLINSRFIRFWLAQGYVY